MNKKSAVVQEIEQMDGPPTTVFVSGCFDRLHPGHIAFLKFARSQGDRLIVHVGTDATIRLRKWREPMFPQADRAMMLEANKYVDRVICATQNGLDDCFDWIRENRPGVWVIGAKDKNDPEKEALANELGIRLVRHRSAYAYSTTGLVNV